MSDPNIHGISQKNYLYEVSQQRKYLNVRERDREDTGQKGEYTFVYCIGSDLFKLHLRSNDVTVKPRNKRGRGYLDIFSNVNEDDARALGAAVTRFIFYELTGDLPLVLLPSIEHQVRGLGINVARAVGIEQTSIIEKVRKDAELALEKIKSQATVAKAGDLTDIIPEIRVIARFLRGDGLRSAEFGRLERLLLNTRVASLERFGELVKGHEAFDGLDDALVSPKLAHGFYFNEDFERWKLVVKKYSPISDEKSNEDDDHRKASERREVSIKRSAHALAMLERLNRRAKELDSPNGRKLRFVLLTGSPAIISASGEFGQPDEVANFVRHPRSYLAERGVLSPPTFLSAAPRGRAFLQDFALWLRIFDATLTKRYSDIAGDPMLGSKVYQERRDDLIAQFDKEFSEYLGHLLLDWQANHISELSDKKKAKDALVGQLARWIEENAQEIDRGTIEAWRRIFSKSAVRGAVTFFIGDNVERRVARARNAPVLLFNSKPITQNLLCRVLTGYPGKEFTPDDLYRSFAEIYDARDESEYCYFLSLGVIFSLENQWEIAVEMARCALDALSDDVTTDLSGREAYYLLAVAKRHTAASPSDIEKSLQALDQGIALNSYAGEKQEDADLAAIRFPVQRIAIEATGFLLEYFCTSASVDSRKILIGCEAALDKVMAELETINGQWKIADSRVHDSLYLAVEQCLRDLHVINLLYLLIVSKEGEIPRERIEVGLDLLQSRMIGLGALIPETFHTRVVLHVASFVAARTESEKLVHKERAEQELTNEKIRMYKTMKYDEKKFFFFRELLVET